ncbi:MAG: YabP/YqfC family sporulation protein [Blautia faecis]
MEEKVVNISHKLILDNRKEASVTGVKDVISFDEKEILLQTADGKLQIRGSGLHVKGLNLEKRRSCSCRTCGFSCLFV